MTALARLVLFCLRHAREPAVLLARLRRLRDLIGEVRRAPNGVEALQKVWHDVLETNDREEPERVARQLLAAVGEDGKEEIVSAAEKLVERERIEGRREELRQTLLKLLAARFGVLPADTVDRVNAAEKAQLDRWFERALTAISLDDALRSP
jgi:hypothetical protein